MASLLKLKVEAFTVSHSGNEGGDAFLVLPVTPDGVEFMAVGLPPPPPPPPRPSHNRNVYSYNYRQQQQKQPISQHSTLIVTPSKPKTHVKIYR